MNANERMSKKELLQKFIKIPKMGKINKEKLYKQVEDIELKVSEIESLDVEQRYKKVRKKFSRLAHSKLAKIDDLLCEASYVSSSITHKLFKDINKLIMELDVNVRYYSAVLVKK